MWLDRPLSATFLFLNMLSRSVITFLPRSKCLLISWLHSPSAVILEPKKGKTVTISIVSLFAMKWWCLMPRSSFFKCWVLSQLFHSPLSRSSKGSNSLLSATGNLNYSLCFIQPYNSDFLQIIVDGDISLPLRSLHKEPRKLWLGPRGLLHNWLKTQHSKN